MNPNGLLFGDGLRCVGGTLKRLYIKSAVAGTITRTRGRRSVGHGAVGGAGRRDSSRRDAVLPDLLPRRERDVLPQSSGRYVQRHRRTDRRLVIRAEPASPHSIEARRTRC